MKDIRRGTPPQHSSEEKVRTVQEGLRCGERIGELCCRESLAQGFYDSSSSKSFGEAQAATGSRLRRAEKRRLAGDTERQAPSFGGELPRVEAAALKAADVCFGRAAPVFGGRSEIKLQIVRQRRLLHPRSVA